MTMSQKEAATILKLIDDVYNLGFNNDQRKTMTWINFLTEDGDYKPSIEAAKSYIKSGNTYPPKLPHILKKEPKKLKAQEIDEETARHRWKMNNDESYKAERKNILDEFKKRIQQFEVNNSE